MHSGTVVDIVGIHVVTLIYSSLLLFRLGISPSRDFLGNNICKAGFLLRRYLFGYPNGKLAYDGSFFSESAFLFFVNKHGLLGLQFII